MLASRFNSFFLLFCALHAAEHVEHMRKHPLRFVVDVTFLAEGHQVLCLLRETGAWSPCTDTYDIAERLDKDLALFDF